MHDEKLKPAAEPALRTTSAGWSSRLDRGALQTVLLSIIAGVMILAALDGASLIAVPTVLAVLCAIALVPAMRWLERTMAPASLCAAFVVGGLLLGAAFTAYALAPSAEPWNDRAPQVLRDAERRTREIVSGISRTLDVEAPVAPAADPGVALSAEPADPAEPELGDDAVGRLVEGGQRLLTDLAIGAPRIAAGAAFWAMLTFFLLRDRVMLARWGMSVVSGASARRAVGRAMRDVRINVARYLLAITAINLGLGVCVAVAFQLLGVSNAPLWGVAAALLNFMPFIGIALLMLVTLGVGISAPPHTLGPRRNPRRGGNAKRPERCSPGVLLR
ncbi:AI-2E family transporter [Tropicimonas aquimaris]|uniref:AI-2E family transporter n=1 Tax=Tropicimonas aquimaris TaxID=914152 RepID=A0ABW3IJL6_9RHOB